MLTRTIRLRLSGSLRVVRPLSTHEPRHEPLAPPIPPLSSLALPEQPTGTFPLYRPPSPRLPSTLPKDGNAHSARFPSDRVVHARIKQKLTQAVEAGLPDYTEAELREFYAAVVQSGSEPGRLDGADRIAGPSRETGTLPAPRQPARSTSQVLRALASRLLEPPSAATQQHEDVDAVEETPVSSLTLISGGQSRNQSLEEILQALSRLVEEQEDNTGSSSSGVTRATVPLGLISRTESRALMAESVDTGNAAAMLRLLDTLPRLGMPIEREYLAQLLQRAASRSDMRGGSPELAQGRQGVMAILTDILLRQDDLQPVEVDSLIQAQIAADHSGNAAISLLRQFERASRPAPQSGYNLVLSHLTTMSPTSASRADAWDLFTHMRLVAHPSPNAEVYRAMIAACSASSDPKPEMARDLWLQMTQETPSDGMQEKIDPAEPDYTAYIRALCSTRATYLEGFEVFRQMLAKHNDATYVPFQAGMGEYSNGLSRYLPTTQTWKALLEGAKRAGDLPRARWVLSECVRLHEALGGRAGMGLDEDIMASAFMAYAAFKPALRREAVRDRGIAKVGEEDEGANSAAASPPASQTDIDASVPEDAGSSGMFGPRVPVTSADAIYEAGVLFQAILDAARMGSSRPPGTNADSEEAIEAFCGVNITPRLVNSYLSVIYAHTGSVADCRQVWSETWRAVNVEPNGWSFLHVLERCAMGQRGRKTDSSTSSAERRASHEWGEELWPEYEKVVARLEQPAALSRDQDQAGIGYSYSSGIGSRQVERCWRARIRFNAINDRLTESLDILHTFHAKFPPERITDTYLPTRQHDFALRFSDPTMIGESDVPPHLLFGDVDVLHQRLVRDERYKDVGRVKYVCQAYETALRRRRKWRMRGLGKDGRKMGFPSGGLLESQSEVS